MKPPGEKAMTVTEVLVTIALIAILILISVPPLGTHNLPRAQMTQTLSNMRQLYTAAFTMALDRTATGDTNLGWPGDTGGTFSNWTAQIVGGDYLTTKDLIKLLSAPGIVLKPKKIPAHDSTAVRVYAVREGPDTNTVFLTTANFTNTPNGGLPPIAGAMPYGTNGFVVFRKGGDGMILKPSQAGDTNLIGGFAPLCR